MNTVQGEPDKKKSNLWWLPPLSSWIYMPILQSIPVKT